MPAGQAYQVREASHGNAVPALMGFVSGSGADQKDPRSIPEFKANALRRLDDRRECFSQCDQDFNGGCCAESGKLATTNNCLTSPFWNAFKNRS